MFSASKSAAPATTGGYQISNSLRFRSSANGNLYRTFSAPTSAYKWTYSGWLKRGIIGSSGRMTFFSNNSYPTYALFSFVASTDQLSLIFQMSDSQTVYVTTSAVFRDPSAWYHIVVSFDSTQSNQANRLFIYVNGVATTFSVVSPYLAYPNQNTYTGINSASQHNLSNLIISGYGPYSEWFDGYRADINFIDGQALTPSSFGEYNVTTGVWQPKQYSGTYGTNGFKLSFSNGTSTTTLGYDSSGNGNNWTTNNISLTAGATYDWMIDSPTSFAGSSYGVGNYAVLNAVASDGTVSNANLTVAWVGGNSAKPATIGMSSGKWYCEIYMDSVGTAALPGLIPSSMIPTAGYPGAASGGYGYYYDGQKYTAGAGSAYGASYTTGDIIGIAFDADSGSLTFYKNGVSQGVAFSGIAAGTWFFAAGHSGTCTMSPNFGQRPFAYTPPTGFKALNTQNLPTPTIQNGAGYMAATTYTGTGATQTLSNAVNSVSFKPDLVWIKSRSANNSHNLADSVRGPTAGLASNSTTAEYTQNGFSSFNASGFTLAADTSQQVNNNGSTYVGWQWKAGGTAVTNTAGSITSSVSANTTSGFSVVTYTGTNSNATVGHGLGVAPSMIINKSRNAAQNWNVFHAGLANMTTAYVRLNTTDAAGTLGNAVATPTSTTFGISASIADTSTYVAYCFAAIPGYSAFGSYTGNGSSDGPFVYCGFRPRYVLIKRTNAVDNWYVEDSSRNTYNATGLDLVPNGSGAELNNTPVIDFLSNGFKLRNTYTGYNASGGTYIYAAFAENPFNYSLAR